MRVRIDAHLLVQAARGSNRRGGLIPRGIVLQRELLQGVQRPRELGRGIRIRSGRFRDRSPRGSRLFRDGAPRHRAGQTKPQHAASRSSRALTTKRSRPITQQPSREQQGTSFSADSARLTPLRCSSCLSASPSCLSDRSSPKSANAFRDCQSQRDRQSSPDKAGKSVFDLANQRQRNVEPAAACARFPMSPVRMIEATVTSRTIV